MDINSFIKKSDLFKKDTVVGIDLGAFSVKVAILKQGAAGQELVRADLREIKTSLQGASREDEIVLAVKGLLKNIDLRHARFVAVVNCPRTAVRRISMPRMPKSELKEAIRLHAAQYFPFPLEDAHLDFQVLDEAEGEKSGKLSVLAATSPKKTVEEALSLFAKVGIKISSLIPAPLSMREASLPYTGQNHETLALLDVGFELTELVIFSGKELVFSRTIPVAGKDFTQAMTVSLASDRGRVQLSTEEAERIKRLTGIPSEGESRLVEDKISTGQILSMLRSPMELLGSEIERCFDYYREETGGGKIDSMLLYGGGAELKGFVKTLSLQLGIEARMGNPLSRLFSGRALQESLTRIEHRLESAVGAALGGSQGVVINLLPPEIKEETQRTFKRASLQSIDAAAVLLFGFILIGMKINISNYTKRAAAANLELASLKPQMEEVQARRRVAEIVQNEPYWEEVFKELSHLVPQNIYLTRLRFQDRTLYLSGVVVSGERQTQISDLIVSLEKGLFDRVRLVTTKEMGTEAANEFELKCWVD